MSTTAERATVFSAAQVLYTMVHYSPRSLTTCKNDILPDGKVVVGVQRGPEGQEMQNEIPQKGARNCTFSGLRMAKTPGFPEKTNLQTLVQKVVNCDS
jgi:hypothetical protein